MILLSACSSQSETHYPDGSKEIRFPDGTVRHIFSNSEEKVVFSDGVVQCVSSNGDKTIDFPDGQREIHTQLYKVLHPCNQDTRIPYFLVFNPFLYFSTPKLHITFHT